MPPNSVPEQSAEANSPGASPTDLSDIRRASGGSSRVLNWFGRSEQRGSRRGSLSSSGSAPKSPMVPSSEMGRIEAVLMGAPLSSTVSNSTGHRSSRNYATVPNSPASPAVRAGSGYYSAHSIQEPMTPQPATIRNSQQAMEEITHAVRRLQADQYEETQIGGFVIDAEAPRNRRRRKKWWWQKDRWKNAQNRLVTAIIAGVLCSIVLSIYLGLALSRHLHLRQEWHVLMILIILVATLFFCHSLVRLCIDLTSSERMRSDSVSFSRIPSIAGPGGYANPRTPIRINLQSPEEIEGMKEPPPVYGLWRCSVRVNPNEFYWVRRDSASPSSPETIQETASNPEPRQSPRPPSYLSDDGVTYFINAAPEVRTDPEQLPPHPSELRRLA